MDGRTEIGEEDPGGEPETKARVRRSVARFDWLQRAFRLALEVVMEGSVAVARSSLGLLLLALRSDESLRCMRESGVSVSEAIMMTKVDVDVDVDLDT